MYMSMLHALTLSCERTRVACAVRVHTEQTHECCVLKITRSAFSTGKWKHGRTRSFWPHATAIAKRAAAASSPTQRAAQ